MQNVMQWTSANDVRKASLQQLWNVWRLAWRGSKRRHPSHHWRGNEINMNIGTQLWCQVCM